MSIQTKRTMAQLNALYHPTLMELITTEGETHTFARDAVNRQVFWHTDDDFVESLIFSTRSWIRADGSTSNTPKELKRMITSARKKGFGDNYIDGQKEFLKPKTKSKNSEADILLEIVLSENTEFFYDHIKRGFVSIRTAEGGKLNFLLDSSQAEASFRTWYYTKTGKGFSKGTLETVLATLTAKALNEGNQEKVFIRIGRANEAVYIDLGNTTGKVVEITKDGYRMTYDCPVKFFRPVGFRELPEPTSGGKLKDLQELLNVDDNNFTIIIAFLLNCLRPDGPYMCLILKGEQGSGKSVISHIIKSIIDPHAASRLRLPKNEEMAMIHALESFLLLYDNVSYISGDMSDVLCLFATGGGVILRTLYKNSEPRIFTVCTPFILNSITDSVQQTDLMERAMPLWLQSMPVGKRRTEAEIFDKFEEILPGILDALYKSVACAISNYPTVPVPFNMRMADSVRWIIAAEPATNFPEGAFLRVLEHGQKELMIGRVINDPLVGNLLKILEHGPFDGMVGQLYQRLESMKEYHDKSFPKSAANFSKLLDRLKPALAKAGIHIEFGERINRGRPIKVWLEEDGMIVNPAGGVKTNEKF